MSKKLLKRLTMQALFSQTVGCVSTGEVRCCNLYRSCGIGFSNSSRVIHKASNKRYQYN